jgi:death-on-curing protein
VSWHWLSSRAVRALRAEQVAEHGGRHRPVEAARLDAALAWPRRVAATEADASAARLAAAYAFGIARERPFVDANRRTAFVAAATFLELNGRSLRASERAAADTLLRLAAERISEPELATWFATHATASAADPA